MTGLVLVNLITLPYLLDQVPLPQRPTGGRSILVTPVTAVTGNGGDLFNTNPPLLSLISSGSIRGAYIFLTLVRSGPVHSME